MPLGVYRQTRLAVHQGRIHRRQHLGLNASEPNRIRGQRSHVTIRRLEQGIGNRRSFALLHLRPFVVNNRVHVRAKHRS